MAFRDHFTNQARILVTTRIQNRDTDVFLHLPGVFSTHPLHGMALLGAIPQEQENRSEEPKVEERVIQVAASAAGNDVAVPPVDLIRLLHLWRTASFDRESPARELAGLFERWPDIRMWV